MANTTKKGAGRESAYQRYKQNNTREKNRTARIERAIRRDPNNEQLVQHLKDVGAYRRKPKTEMWSPSRIVEMEILNKFKLQPNYKPKISPNTKKLSMFALGVRLELGN